MVFGSQCRSDCSDTSHNNEYVGLVHFRRFAFVPLQATFSVLASLYLYTPTQLATIVCTVAAMLYA